MSPIETTHTAETNMKRRTFLAASAAILATTAVRGAPALEDDDAHARYYDSARRFMNLPAGRVAYIDRGKGPAALFLHGFPLSSFQWRGAIDRLSRERRCLAPDLLG